MSEANRRLVRTTLASIAHGRSGDKGNHSNVAIIAYSRPGYDWLVENLTIDRVAQYFAPLQHTGVERYLAENVLGLNFMLRNALGGGASQSLRSDTQGKTYALALLQMEVELPEELVQST